jgi:beta-lactam-binding protein with PASTA domain
VPVRREQEVAEPDEDGRVIDQRPAAGVEVDSGREVVIVVGALVEEEQLAPVEPDPAPEPVP